MASISFFAGSTAINNLSGSGLGFFGGSFGQSVQLNSWQDTTFITDGNGQVPDAVHKCDHSARHEFTQIGQTYR